MSGLFYFFEKVDKFAECRLSPLTFIKVSVHRRDLTYRIALFPLSSRPTWQTIFKHSAIPQPCQKIIYLKEKIIPLSLQHIKVRHLTCFIWKLKRSRFFCFTAITFKMSRLTAEPMNVSCYEGIGFTVICYGRINFIILKYLLL